MKNLLIKEFRLTMHPTSVLFLCLSAMLLIPNYPYGVAFFYTGLAVFFTCLSGRENNDVFYTMTLPVEKKDIVGARILHVCILQLLQIVIAVPFAVIRGKFNLPGNAVGMDANIAMFGFAFIQYGLFNLTFLVPYYRNVKNVGKSFALSSVFVFLFICFSEAATNIFPFFRDKLDTPDPQFFGYKMMILAIGIILFSLLTLLTYAKAVKLFRVQDI